MCECVRYSVLQTVNEKVRDCACVRVFECVCACGREKYRGGKELGCGLGGVYESVRYSVL